MSLIRNNWPRFVQDILSKRDLTPLSFPQVAEHPHGQRDALARIEPGRVGEVDRRARLPAVQVDVPRREPQRIKLQRPAEHRVQVAMASVPK